MLISKKKYEYLNDVFLDMKESQILVVALLATERMWRSFADFLIPERSPNLEENVRTCLEIIWEKAIEGAISSDQNEKYSKLLQIINDSADEENPEEEFLAPYPLYLIGQLYSGMLSSDKIQMISVCASVTVRPLDMICDVLLDEFPSNILDKHPAVLTELNHIDEDIATAKKHPLNIEEILSKKELYQTLQIVSMLYMDKMI